MSLLKKTLKYLITNFTFEVVMEELLNLSGKDLSSSNQDESLEARREKIYDLHFNKGKTLQEIGDQFEISRERVRQIIEASGEAPAKKLEQYCLRKTGMSPEKFLEEAQKFDSLEDMARNICITPASLQKVLLKLQAPKELLQKLMKEKQYKVPEVLRDLYETQKKSAIEIAKMFNTSPCLIYGHLRKNKIPVRRDHSKTQALTRDTLIQLLEEGNTVEDIALKFGVTWVTARAKIKKLGIEYDPRNRISTRQKQIIESIKEELKSSPPGTNISNIIAKVADKFKISTEYAYRVHSLIKPSVNKESHSLNIS